MNDLLRKTGKFFKRNGSTILTCMGGAGVVATTVMAVKATPKALRLLDNAKEEKGEELTKLEIVKTAGPIYIPTIVVGVSTLTCIFGANILNRKQQAALTSAYALLDSSYKEYKKKVNELYGDDADRQVKNEIAKDKYEESKPEVSNNKRLFFDEYSGRYFQSTMENVLRAEYELNRMLSRDWGVFLNEFYEVLGLERTDYGDFLGWSSCELCDTYWYSWVEFEHQKVVMDDGLECYIITMLTEPTFDFENY